MCKCALFFLRVSVLFPGFSIIATYQGLGFYRWNHSETGLPKTSLVNIFLFFNLFLFCNGIKEH